MNSESRWRRWYGGPVWTLPILLGSLTVTGYVVDKVVQGPMAVRIVVWFAAAAALHDFVLFPAYSVIDRAMNAIAGRSGSERHLRINYIRVPAALSLLMFLIYLPTILGRGAGAFRAASGLEQIDIFVRWIWLSLGFFAVSGSLYALRLLIFRHSTKERT